MKLFNKIEEIFDNMIGREVFEKDSNFDELFILLKAMIYTAKSDGNIDEHEQAKIIEFMGDMNEKSRLFVEQEMKKESDMESFLAEIPKGMEQQVYYMSLFTIDLDLDIEKDYLIKLAKDLNLTKEEITNIHESLDVEVFV